MDFLKIPVRLAVAEARAGGEEKEGAAVCTGGGYSAGLIPALTHFFGFCFPHYP